jgi:hypothetical protein
MYSDYDSEADEPDYLALGGDITWQSGDLGEIKRW